MIVIPYPEQAVIKAGYIPHKNGVASNGYIREISLKMRYHILHKWNHNKVRLELHVDFTTRKGFHDSSPSPKLERKEKNRIKRYYFPENKQKKDPTQYIIRRKVIRDWKPLADFLKKWRIPFKAKILKFLIKRSLTIDGQ